MDSLNLIGPLIAIAGAGAVVLVIVAIVQDLKQDRKYGYRQAFLTIVSLVMLVMLVGSTISLIAIGAKQLVFPAAKEYQQRFNSPPYLSLGTDKPSPTTAAYACTSGCDFSAEDKTRFANWKTEYQNWQSTSSFTPQLRRELAGSLSLFIITLPLYMIFFRLMNRGAKEETTMHARPAPLRSVYFYGVAFAGIVLAVIGGAMILNTTLRSVLKTDAGSNISVPERVPAPSETMGADSVVACATACGFTAEDVTLAQAWKADYQAYQQRSLSNAGASQNDIANALPALIVGLPLFWYHFARIRKETAGPDAEAPTVA